MRRGVALIAGVLGLLAVSPASGVAAVTFGDDLQTDPGASSFNCDATPCTDFLSNLAATHEAPGGFTSPMEGVVVSFSIRAGIASTPVTFRLVRPTGTPGEYTGGGTRLPAVTPAADATTSYAARLPVRVGDRVGIDCCAGGGDSYFYSLGAGNAAHSYWNSLTPPQILVDGGPGRAPFGTNDGFALAVQARVEPDADHDGFGDETQDACPTDASTQGACPAAAAPTSTSTASAPTSTGAAKRKCKRHRHRSAAAAKKRCKRKRPLS